jgi:hypothetical protein
VAGLEVAPSGLYEVLWRAAAERAELELVTTSDAGAAGLVVDCGTPPDYLRANLHACGGRSAIGTGATIHGTVRRCVVWDGAWVGPHEHLVEVIRAGTERQPVTVPGRITPTR